MRLRDNLRLPLTLLLLVALGGSVVLASPWNPTLTPVSPYPGAGLPSATQVPGKDFSDYRDRDENGVDMPEQVVAWDGFGGTRNATNYAGSRVLLPELHQVDAISNGGDALFTALREDRAAMIFSVGDVGVGGRVADPTIYYVKPTLAGTVPGGHGVWATPLEIDDEINPDGTSRIRDVDGLEVWGDNQTDDSDRYSLYGDPFVNFPDASRKVAIWQYDAASHVSSPHTFTSDLAAAMDLQFGGPGEGGPLFGLLVEMMDLDAMMTQVNRVTYSIAPLDLTWAGLPAGFPSVFHGGEIFEYDGPGQPTRFLEMGGYVWDTNLDLMATFGVPSNNVNALEAVAVPEPSTMLLTLTALLGIAYAHRGGVARHRTWPRARASIAVAAK